MNNSGSAVDKNNGEGRMEKVTLSEATREKVDEAALAVLMEQCGTAIDAGVEIKMAECADMEFPPNLDKRIQKAIAREQAKKRNKQCGKVALRVLRSAVAVIAVLLCAGGILFMTVEAFHVPVMNFFIEKTERYWQFSGSNDPDVNGIDTIPDDFNPENPLCYVIPFDYELEAFSGTVEDGNLFAKYSNADNSTIYFYIQNSSGNLQIDTEGAHVTHLKVEGHDAYTVVEGDLVSIVWLNENMSRTFSMFTTKVAEEAVIDFAEAIAQQFA